jgi:hypothetical protein
MKTSENLSNIAKALVQVQAEAKGINKNAQGHGYKYISFDAILTLIKPVLSKHGVYLIQNVKGEIVNGENLAFCETRLLHESGEWVESDILALKPVSIGKGGQPAPVTPQVVGSALTYAKRYQLCGMLGINADVDDDAAVASSQEAWGQVMTKEQKDLILKLIPQKGLSKETFNETMVRAIGTAKDYKTFTKDEAASMINEMQSLPNAEQPQVPAQ